VKEETASVTAELWELQNSLKN